MAHWSWIGGYWKINCLSWSFDFLQTSICNLHDAHLIRDLFNRWIDYFFLHQPCYPHDKPSKLNEVISVSFIESAEFQWREQWQSGSGWGNGSGYVKFFILFHLWWNLQWQEERHRHEMLPFKFHYHWLLQGTSEVLKTQLPTLKLWEVHRTTSFFTLYPHGNFQGQWHCWWQLLLKRTV